MARGQKNRTENVMLYCTDNKYENFLIDSQTFTKNRCILQGIDNMTNLMQEWAHE